MQIMKVWYSFRNNGVYNGDSPAFFDLSDKKWFNDLVANLPAIQQAVLEFIEHAERKRGEYFNKELVEGQTWEGFSFMLWGRKNEDNFKNGEKFLKYFLPIPGLVSFSISMLSPQTHIVEHYGDTDANYRLHVPILIPAMLPECGFRVSGTDVSWDKIFAFSDAHLHEAWNKTDKLRIILMVDVLREGLESRRKSICYNVLSLLELQKLYLNNKMVRNAPWYIKGILRHLILWRIWITGKSSMKGA
jgi:hypothetical protein